MGKRILVVDEAWYVMKYPVGAEFLFNIAKRGRKRWLGLVFVTQLPQHLPDEMLGLINNFILHKIADGTVVDRLRKSISGITRLVIARYD